MFSKSICILIVLLYGLNAQAVNKVKVDCRGCSFIGGPVSYSYYGDRTMFFTTFDGSSSKPQSGGSPLYSLELSPKVNGATGEYVSDIISSDGEFYGAAYLTMPTADSDNDGWLDFLQLDKAVNATYSGKIYEHYDYGDSLDTVLLNGNIIRSANSKVGTMHGRFGGDGGWINFTSPFRLMGFSSEADNIPSTTGSIPFTIEYNFSVFGGTDTTLSGTMNYTVVDKDTISFDAFTVSGGGKSVHWNAFNLARSGNKYKGDMTSTDGFPFTVGNNYCKMLLQIEDNNDADQDGIPDFSDLAPLAPSNVSATVEAHADKVDVSWNAVHSAERYDVFRNTSDQTSTATRIGSSTTLSYEDTTAVKRQTYYYWVKTICGVDSSEFSATDSGWVFDTDVDDDEMLDSWEISNFENTTQTPDSDYDGDGLTNIEEFLANLDPKVAEIDTKVTVLQKGWNLLSVSPWQNDECVQTCYGNCTTSSVWAWDPLTTRYTDASNGNLKTLKGYWVFVEELTAVSYVCPDDLEPTSYDQALHVGWNLISIGAPLTGSSFRQYFTGHPSTVWGWDLNHQTYINSSYTVGSEFNGYWIYTAVDDSFSYTP